MAVTHKTIEWSKVGSLYMAELGYTPEDKKAYIYSTKPAIPAYGDVIRYGDALLVVEGRRKIMILEAEGRQVTRCEGAKCLFFGSQFTLDLTDFNRLLIIVIMEAPSALIEVEKCECSRYTIEVNDSSVIEYPQLSIEAYYTLKQQQ
jgi:hypothetical protein